MLPAPRRTFVIAPAVPPLFFRKSSLVTPLPSCSLSPSPGTCRVALSGDVPWAGECARLRVLRKHLNLTSLPLVSELTPKAPPAPSPLPALRPSPGPYRVTLAGDAPWAGECARLRF